MEAGGGVTFAAQVAQGAQTSNGPPAASATGLRDPTAQAAGSSKSNSAAPGKLGDTVAPEMFAIKADANGAGGSLTGGKGMQIGDGGSSSSEEAAEIERLLAEADSDDE